MKILVTGTAGFIGFHLVERLMKEFNWDIIGLDNINDYYDVNLKYARLKESGIAKEEIKYNQLIQSNKSDKYRFIKLNLEDKDNILKLFENENFDYVVHLAAQAGVRYSIENPYAFISSNIVGFMNVLEGCRHNSVKHLVYASSSSVYGTNSKLPFSESDRVDTPISLYAATKKSNELMAHNYGTLYNLPTTGLRFFTVYGPWGRPDMAYFKFTKSIFEEKRIEVFNNGEMHRDLTYIDDIIKGILLILKKPFTPKNVRNKSYLSNYKIYNIGNSHSVKLSTLIRLLETICKKKSRKKFLPLQSGDMIKTFSDINAIQNEFGYIPTTKLKHGLRIFVEWFIKYYNK